MVDKHQGRVFSIEICSGTEDVTFSQSVVHHFTRVMIKIDWSRTTNRAKSIDTERGISLINEMGATICAFYLCLNSLERERLGTTFMKCLKGTVARQYNET